MDFGILKRSNPKSGRRARQNDSSSTSSKEGNVSQPSTLSKPDIPQAAARTEGKEIPPRSSRRNTTLSGWGETTANKDMLEDARFMVNDDDTGSDLNESIQIIPDIDDVHTEDMMQQMAAPPTVSMNQVATYRELDSDLIKKSTFLMLDNEIDLKLLAKHLIPESEVQEPKQSWEWERLFTDVSSKINSESLKI